VQATDPLLAIAAIAADSGNDGSDSWLIALAGVVAGAAIAVGYDLVKSRRLESKRNTLIMQLLAQDLEDVKDLSQDIKGRIAIQRGMVPPDVAADPIPRLSTDLWDILRLGIPPDLLADRTLMDDLRAIHLGVGIISQVLDAREDRRRNIALSGRREAINTYDTMTETRIDILEPMIARATASLGAHIRHR
jgi:hypothetical protein